jgi:cell division FtsZ-interacting protein ZapD
MDIGTSAAHHKAAIELLERMTNDPIPDKDEDIKKAATKLYNHIDMLYHEPYTEITYELIKDLERQRVKYNAALRARDLAAIKAGK